MSRKATLAFLLSVLVFGGIVFSNWGTDGPTSLNADDQHHTSQIDIFISQNEDWITQGWPGNGTSASPYLIENMTLDDFYVQHSTSHFLVKNCQIESELHISDSSNFTFENVILGESSGFGEVSNFLLQGVTKEDAESGYGIHLVQASNFTVQSCTITESSYTGLVIDECSNGVIQENVFSLIGHRIYVTQVQSAFNYEFNPSQDLSYSFGEAIWLGQSSNINITQNDIVGNIGSGIIATNSVNVSIDSNLESGNDRGFRLSDSSGIRVIDNTIEDSISFHNCINTMLVNNTIDGAGLSIDGDDSVHYMLVESNNTVAGSPLLYMMDSQNQIIQEGTFGQVLLFSSSNILFRDLMISGGDISIQIRNCTGVRIESSICSSIHVEEAINCSIVGTVVTGGQTAIRISYSPESIEISDSIITDCEYGLYLFGPSSKIMIVNNSVTDVRYTGIQIHKVTNAIILNNTISNCAEQFIDSHWHIVHNPPAVAVNMNDSLFVNNTVTWNNLGISFAGTNNTLYGNTFAGNPSGNAIDNGFGNQWDDGVSIGNSWGNYWGAGYYYIPGTANSVDRFPLLAPGYEYDSSFAILNQLRVVVILFAVVSPLLIYLNRKRSK